jgi:hypothetical protein
MTVPTTERAAPRPDDAEIIDFVERRLASIDGWLALPAAHLTYVLMARQNARGVEGGVLELGVFRGKYLALLYAASAAASRPVLGVDLFPGMDEPSIASAKEQIAAAVTAACGDAGRLRLLAADTLRLSRADVASHLQVPLAFVSVDAGHEAVHLYNDIGLAADMIGPGGIIAVDDAFNHTTPGAIEGTCRFFQEANEGRVVPFAHCYNKLFLCRLVDHRLHLDLCQRFVVDRPELDYCVRTLARKRENDAVGFVPRFFGSEILPFL